MARNHHVPCGKALSATVCPSDWPQHPYLPLPVGPAKTTTPHKSAAHMAARPLAAGGSPPSQHQWQPAIYAQPLHVPARCGHTFPAGFWQWPCLPGTQAHSFTLNSSKGTPMASSPASAAGLGTATPSAPRWMPGAPAVGAGPGATLRIGAEQWTHGMPLPTGPWHGPSPGTTTLPWVSLPPYRHFLQSYFPILELYVMELWRRQ